VGTSAVGGVSDGALARSGGRELPPGVSGTQTHLVQSPDVSPAKPVMTFQERIALERQLKSEGQSLD
jgi:hypothetical protein